jgi:hypothetical protein
MFAATYQLNIVRRSTSKPNRPSTKSNAESTLLRAVVQPVPKSPIRRTRDGHGVGWTCSAVENEVVVVANVPGRNSADDRLEDAKDEGSLLLLLMFATVTRLRPSLLNMSLSI